MDIKNATTIYEADPNYYIYPKMNKWNMVKLLEGLTKFIYGRRLLKIIKVSSILGFFLLLSSAGISQNLQSVKRKGELEKLPRDLEIQLALSALPSHLKDSATVYVLNPDKGFEVARKGSNGFYAFVARNGDDAMRGSWPLNEYRDDILYPISFDETGAKAQMRVFFDIAAMQAKGTTPERLKKTIQERYKTHYYKAPERAGVSYMLSPILRTYSNPDANNNVQTTSNPHVMYYAPNISNHDLGGVKPSLDNAYPFVIMQGPHGYTIQNVGEKERAIINNEYEEMLERLCKIKAEWCLPKKNDSNLLPMHHHQLQTETMDTKDFTTSFTVDKTPKQLFDAINNVRGWWSEEIEGKTDVLNSEFNYHYKDVHRSKMKIIEFIEGKKIVWLVQDNYFEFTKDKNEWKGTKIIFEIVKLGNKTQLIFTHKGLVPQYECFTICTDAWTQYIQKSLYNLVTTGTGLPNRSDNPQTENERKLGNSQNLQ